MKKGGIHSENPEVQRRGRCEVVQSIRSAVYTTDVLRTRLREMGFKLL